MLAALFLFTALENRTIKANMESAVHMRGRQGGVWWIMVLGLWLLSGCLRPQVAGVVPMDWTAATSGAYASDQGRVFFGIGRASGLRSATLLRATADNQAQSEMADIVKGYLASLADASGIDISRSESRQMLYDLSRAVMKQARIVDHRYSDDAGMVMALCRLDLETLKQVLAANPYADPAVSKRLLLQAEKIHAQMVGHQF